LPAGGGRERKRRCKRAKRGSGYLLLDLTDGLEIGSPVEDIAAEEEKLDEVASDVTTGDVETTGQVGQREALVHGHDVGHTVTRIDDHTSKQTLGVEGQDSLVHRKENVKECQFTSSIQCSRSENVARSLKSMAFEGFPGCASYLNGDVGGLEAVLLEHDLDHLLAVGEGVHGRLSEQDLAVLGVHLQLLCYIRSIRLISHSIESKRSTETMKERPKEAEEAVDGGNVPKKV
jgi:hypothetical protein